MKEYTIDAKGKSLGRIASEAALILRGKNNVGFKTNTAPDLKLSVINVNEIKITGQKLKQKKHASYSGYPGGLSFTILEKNIKEKGMAFVFKKAVAGMLPKNKMSEKMIKNLSIK